MGCPQPLGSLVRAHVRLIMLAVEVCSERACSLQGGQSTGLRRGPGIEATPPPSDLFPPTRSYLQKYHHQPWAKCSTREPLGTFPPQTIAVREARLACVSPTQPKASAQQSSVIWQLPGHSHTCPVIWFSQQPLETGSCTSSFGRKQLRIQSVQRGM